jgi:threonylcarbamoyladenosine tRNA methylthiotransferase MtaB
MSRTVAFATLGCRLNQVDSRALAGLLEARGFTAVPEGAPADVVVVNTCAVTGRAEFSDRQAIRRAARVSPGARLVVTGCWAQTGPAAVAALPGVDLVVGNADKARLPDLVEALLAEPRGGPARVAVGDVSAARTLEPAPPTRNAGRSRAFLKVQDGCQHRCAFCIVPFARGGSRSLAPGLVEAEARRLVAAGHRELTLTGVDLGHYGADLAPPTTLAALLARLCGIAGLRWLRLSSLLPAYVTDALLDVLTGSPVVAPHFHLQLQSGSDRVLRRMRRPYTVAMYRRVVERLARAIPALGLGADVIAGFPGETEADFAETVRLVEALPFTYLHVFPYSPRPGTEAAHLCGRVDARTSGRRSRALRAIAEARRAAFAASLVGGVSEALVLDTRDRASGRLVGLTGHYVEVALDGPDALMRRIVRLRVTGADGGRATGDLEAAA